MSDTKGPILHVIVVGFHHKKGCQVEYSFPPLVPDQPNECPPGWKYLPTLALPDGSHNFDNDTAYFHLPSLTEPKKTIFGISCYRQIPVEKLKNRTDDITRSSVQKSVCVLSTISLYGHIQVKMSLITHAYFEEGDFSKVSLLEDTYYHLNTCLQNQLPSQLFVGLSARDLILHWRHKVVLLFKLLLLEKRIIFYRSPVQSLCTTILTLLSLHPGMIERGLDESACVRPSRPISPLPDFPYNDDSPTNSTDGKNNVDKTIDVNIDQIASSQISQKKLQNGQIQNGDDKVLEKKMREVQQLHSRGSVISLNKNDKDGKEEVVTGDEGDGEQSSKSGNSLTRELSMDTINDVSVQNTITTIAHINAELCGTPLPIFTKGYMCLPYLSLPYMDLLSDLNVRGYVVGATNVLFKQKRQLADVLIDIELNRIESQDVELRKLLHLTTEDLRFADFLVKHVADERHDVFLDGVGWEGGDEWIRSQFRVYLLCLLRTSLLPENSREYEHFNSSFMNAWMETHSYKVWLGGNNTEIMELNAGHPFAGQLSVADMKLRLAHTMQNTEGGRKINQAMATTGRAVATTGRAVGGALSQAKGALTNWWSNLATTNEEHLPNSRSSKNIAQLEQEQHDIDEINKTEESIERIMQAYNDVAGLCDKTEISAIIDSVVLRATETDDSFESNEKPLNVDVQNGDSNDIGQSEGQKPGKIHTV